jgi:hypothetical protein
MGPSDSDQSCARISRAISLPPAGNDDCFTLFVEFTSPLVD